MRSRERDAEEKVWPIFEIGPILQHYGGDEVDETDGRWRKYCCPFHGERNPSASVNGYDKVFVCHACEIKGNAVQCIMKHEGITYGPALKRAKEITGESNAPVQPAFRRSG